MREEDRPKRTPATALQLLARAERAGEQVSILCQAIHRQDGEPGVRRILGVLSLCKRHGAARVDDACAAALALELPTYRFVKRYVERQPELSLTLKQARFRDVNKALDGFDFKYNAKIDRASVFELATGRFIGWAEDPVFLGPPRVRATLHRPSGSRR